MWFNNSRLLAVAATGLWFVGQTAADSVNIGATQDNTMFEAIQTNSNGAGSFLFAGRSGALAGLTLHRGLLEFDIAGNIPAGACISAVALTLHLSRSPFNQTSNVALHGVDQAWGEGSSNSDGFFPGEGAGAPAQPGDATWLRTFFPGSTWNNLGGDMAPSASATQTIGFVPGFFTWSSAAMAADVQLWLDNPGSNFGWAILGDESGSPQTSKRFDSRENSNLAFRPMLAVTFSTTCPEDVNCTGDVNVTDLLMVLAGWGTAAGDITGDGNTNVTDLLQLLGQWGPC